MTRVQERLSAANFFVTCELHEDLPYIARYTGTDHLMLGSDYGHPGDIADTIICYRERLDARPDLDQTFKRKLVCDNCNSFFRL